MIISEGYILLLMLSLSILAVYVIPEMLKEHHIPMFLRDVPCALLDSQHNGIRVAASVFRRTGPVI